VLEVSSNDFEAVETVNGKNGEKPEVRNEDGPIEPAKLMDTGKGIVKQSPRQLVE